MGSDLCYVFLNAEAGKNSYRNPIRALYCLSAGRLVSRYNTGLPNFAADLSSELSARMRCEFVLELIALVRVATLRPDTVPPKGGRGGRAPPGVRACAPLRNSAVR